MIQYTNDKFLNLKINTNASLLTEKMSLNIIKWCKTGIFLLMQLMKTYSKLRVNGNLKSFKNIEMFNSIRNKHYKRKNNYTSFRSKI